MRQDQFERLQALEEKLIDVLIKEADPDNWPGAGLDDAKMSRDVRGDRVWVKRSAIATAALLQRAVTLTQVIRMSGIGTTPAAEGAGDAAADEQASQLDAEVDAAEREGERLLKRIQATARSTASKKAHGRA